MERRVLPLLLWLAALGAAGAGCSDDYSSGYSDGASTALDYYTAGREDEAADTDTYYYDSDDD